VKGEEHQEINRKREDPTLKEERGGRNDSDDRGSKEDLEFA